MDAGVLAQASWRALGDGGDGGDGDAGDGDGQGDDGCVAVVVVDDGKAGEEGEMARSWEDTVSVWPHGWSGLDGSPWRCGRQGASSLFKGGGLVVMVVVVVVVVVMGTGWTCASTNSMPMVVAVSASPFWGF